ncbi:MAG TPA: hypothetical protein PLW16_08690, partial [Syntrophales bacterium]|nr:hypothetical protein [Syntrophales bacterium]
DYSPATAEAIDREVREIIGREYRRARDILADKRAVLLKGAQRLLEQEKIDGEEIRVLLVET